MPGSAPSAVSSLSDRAAVRAAGRVQMGDLTGACEVEVAPEGLTLTAGEGTVAQWPAHEIERVEREDYTIGLRRALGRGSMVLTRFARRTDELVLALRHCRADALAALMSPPGELPREVTEAAGGNAGLLFRYDDGLRWVPDEGMCFARLYGELDAAEFDAGSYALVLRGPFGESRVEGLRRLTSEIGEEAALRIENARRSFGEALEAAGLPWSGAAASGSMRRHVPFRPSEAQLRQIDEAADLVHEERRDYWAVLREAHLVERLVISADEDGLRLATLCPVVRGELYELLSEADHASYVFESADDAVRAWTEVGFRRQPIFGGEDDEAYRVLAGVLPSLRAARDGLRQRVVHDDPAHWRSRLI